MKKTFLFILLLLVVGLFWPVVSLNWYRHTHEKKFIAYGVLGTIGILGLIALWFIPIGFWYGMDLILICITHFFPGIMQYEMLARRRRIEDATSSNPT